MRYKKRLSTIIVLLIVILISLGIFFYLKSHQAKQSTSTSSEPTPSPWVGFFDPEKRFSVLLPTYPTYSQKTNPQGLLFEEYSTATSSSTTTYAVYVIPIKSGVTLDTQVKNILSTASPSGKLIYADQNTEASGIKYLDYKITNSDLEYKGRMFLVDKLIYQLLRIAPLNEKKDQDFNDFISSFALISQ